MSKLEKGMGIDSHADKRRMGDEECRRLKANKGLDRYPPHWEIRVYGQKPLYLIGPHKYAGEVRDMTYGTVPYRLHGVREQLEYLAGVYPGTADWPVRFLQGAPVDCGRKIIQ